MLINFDEVFLDNEKWHVFFTFVFSKILVTVHGVLERWQRSLTTVYVEWVWLTMLISEVNIQNILHDLLVI